MLECSNLSYRIGDKVLLRDFNLTVQPGEFVALVGPNGAGKSTALRLMGGELKPCLGTVVLSGTPLHKLSTVALAQTRACFQQNPPVDYPYTVREIAALGRHPHRRGVLESEHDHEVVAGALRDAGIAHLSERLQTTLSGGEATRAHLARVLAQEPRLLLLDEPTNHLDIRYQQEILRACKARCASGCAIVAVLHDLNMAAHFSDRMVLLNHGVTVAQGNPWTVLTADAIGSVYDLDCAVWEHPSGCPWVVPLMSPESAPVHFKTETNAALAANGRI